MIENIKKYMVYLATVILISIFIANIIYTAYVNWFDEKVSYSYTNILLIIICFIILGILVYSICKKIKISTKVFLSLVILLQILVGIFWIQTSRNVPRADQKIVFDVANEFIQGNFDELNEAGYAGKNRLQLGLITYIKIINKYVANNYYIHYYINLTCVCVITIFLYKITDIIYKNEIFNKVCIFISLSFVQLLFITTFLYGDLISLALASSSIFFIIKFVKDRKTYCLALSVILIAGACIVRTNTFIIVIAQCIYLLFNFMQNRKIEDILIVIVLILSIIVPRIYIDYYYKTISRINITSGVPTVLYLRMGIGTRSPRAPGWYDAITDITYAEYKCDSKEINKYQWPIYASELLELVKHPLNTSRYFLSKKLISTWCEPTNQSLYVNYSYELPWSIEEITAREEHINNNKILNSILFGKIRTSMEIYMKIILLTIYLGSIYRLIRKEKKLELEELFLVTIFLGGFFFHLIWETKSRYVIPYEVLLIPLSTNVIIFYEDVINKIKKVKELK